MNTTTNNSSSIDCFGYVPTGAHLIPTLYSILEFYRNTSKLRSMFTLLEPYADKLTIITSIKAKPVDLHAWSVEHNVPVYQMVQVHGNTVVRVDEATPNLQQADAVCTNRSDIALSVRYADCQNFVLYDPVQHVVSCVHAGYKGIVAKVLTECIQTMVKEYNCKPADMLVVSDASLSKECAEFTDPIKELPGIDPKYFEQRLVDLVQIAYDELIENGVQPEHIELSNKCTKCNKDEWYSYRGDEAVKIDSALRNVLITRLL